jgi:hypothetical protein
MKKIILTVFAATSLLLYSTQAFALLNFSVGVPLSHTFTGKWSDGTAIESDGVGGYFIQIGVPMLPGLGMDSHKVRIKNDSNIPHYVSTTMYNLYYILPIPIINLTLGVGTGKSQFEILGLKGDDGTATQWYTSLGIPILPLFDLHLSYRSISSKIESTSGNDKGKKDDVGGNVMGLGIGFNF